MHSFVFSGKTAPRLARHLAFWVLYFAGTFLSHLPYLPNLGHGSQGYQYAFIQALWLFPVNLMAVYSALYIALPIYLRTRKVWWVILYAVVMLAISISAGYYIDKEISRSTGGQSDAYDLLGWAIHSCMGDLLTITIAAVIIKIMKEYWLRQRENDLLAIENVRNKLHLLKSQMHPRVLFVALQRISQEIDGETGEAPGMILKLSDLLSYLLYESESAKAPQSKEAQMIANLKSGEDSLTSIMQYLTDGPT